MTEEMKNIELFDMYTSYLFNKLYQAFPVCVSVDSVADEVTAIDKAYALEFEKHSIAATFSHKKLLFSETVLWLTTNGFIDFADAHPNTKRPPVPFEYDYFSCISLTLKGLNLLTSPKPKSISKHKRLGDEIVEKVRLGALSEAGKLLTENMYDIVSRSIN